MAVGFGSVDGVQDTIASTVANAVDFARANLYRGVSPEFCDECDEKIPLARRKAISTRYCVKCQNKFDKKISPMYNRRGSKDSQLR